MAKTLVNVEFELTLCHLSALPPKLSECEMLWKWKKGKGPSDRGSSGRSTLPRNLDEGVDLSLPVSFTTHLTLLQQNTFNKREIACTVKYVSPLNDFSLEIPFLLSYIFCEICCGFDSFVSSFSHTTFLRIQFPSPNCAFFSISSRQT